MDNEVGLQGSGLIGFAAIAFSAHSTTASVIDIPQYVMGRRDGRVWLTAVSTPDSPADPDALTLAHAPLSLPREPRIHPGRVSAESYVDIVARAVERLRQGADAGAGAGADPLGKVVLARDEVVETAEDIDVRAVLGRLNSAYPNCWTFDVAGLVGATPELLIGVSEGQVTSRVLAGTYQVEDDPAAEIAREEVFGPVVVATEFTDDDQAVALANGTDYGLVSAVWTKDVGRAHRMAAEIEAGQVFVNTYGAGGGVELPFGGFKKSGYGREKSIEAFDEYTQTKTVVIKL